MLDWQCPSPQNGMRAAGVRQHDAFKNKYVDCLLLQVCECVILKKNNNLSIPRFPPIPVSDGTAVGPFNLYGLFRWMCCPAGVMAADWFLDRVNEAGCSRLDCPSISPSISPPPPPPASSSLPLLFFLLSDVSLHVQGQVV